MNINSLEQIETIFKSHGAEQIYIKKLALKQDNDKNQIYLGGINGISNLFPSELRAGTISTSVKKDKSSPGKAIIYAILNYYWLDEKGRKYKAPNAKNINYFQYAKSGEVRLSAFLTNCDAPPDCLRREKQHIYGKRILILGFNRSGETFGLALNEKEDLIVSNFPQFKDSDFSNLIKIYVLGNEISSSPRDLLIDEIRNLCGIWHHSITLKEKGAKPIPFKGNQGAGYTLEALLGIPRNSSKKPDKYGFEIKSFKSDGKISLMTPTADIGEEGKLPFREFMNLYGWRGERHKDSIVFNGIFRYHKPNKRTQYVLDIPGFKPEKIQKTKEKITVGLYQKESPQLVSGWSFQKLLDSWSEKHSSACYVEYISRAVVGKNNTKNTEYLYTGRIYIGIGTQIFYYLNSITKNIVYYDPGHEIDSSNNASVRPQWRMSIRLNFGKDLMHLYKEVHHETLL